MKPVLSLCTYPYAQIGSSLYPLIVQVHLQIQAEHEKKPRLSFKILMLGIVLLMDWMEDDVRMTLISAEMVLPSAILIPDFPLTRMGNTLPENSDGFFFPS